MNKQENPSSTVAPAFAERNIAVFCSADSRYVLYCCVMLHSLIRHASQAWNYDLVVLEEELSPADKQQIASLAEGRANISIRFFNVSACMQGHVFHVNETLTLATWYRIFAPSIFRQYEKVLYLDVDVIVLADIAELYNVDMGENWLAGCSDLTQIAVVARKGGAYLRDRVGVPPHSYVNAGVLLFNICQMNRYHVEHKCIEAAQRYHFESHDQDTLNHVCAGHVLLLDQAWNVFPVRGFEAHVPGESLRLWQAARQTPRIIHYVMDKPWADPLSDEAGRWWAEAARTPYHETLLRSHLLSLLDDAMNATRNRWKYEWLRVLTLCTWGQLRADLTSSKRCLRMRLHRVRRWRAQLAQYRRKG